MTKLTTQRQIGVQTEFTLRPEYEAEHPMLVAFHAAMEAKHVLLPDGRTVQIKRQDIMPNTDEDIWCDDFEWIIEPSYEQRLACILETLVRAGLCPPSGEQRYHFILRCLSQIRSTGDLFDSNCRFIDRNETERDWRKDRDFCAAFPDIPRRCMNRLKERMYHPRRRLLNQSKGDVLFLRLCYISLAIKSLLARAGYPEFCVAESWQDI